jgi:exopolyphosphatase/guanosine-5'-triphosphate,3'-diphosphate pyrophosphatase
MIKINMLLSISGSNAMRLLIINIVEQEGKEPQFNKSSLVRVLFVWVRMHLVGEISEENIDRMCDDESIQSNESS